GDVDGRVDVPRRHRVEVGRRATARGERDLPDAAVHGQQGGQGDRPRASGVGVSEAARGRARERVQGDLYLVDGGHCHLFVGVGGCSLVVGDGQGDGVGAGGGVRGCRGRAGRCGGVVAPVPRVAGDGAVGISGG